MSDQSLFWTAPDGLILHARDYAPVGEVERSCR
jgi:hypothetical protein